MFLILFDAFFHFSVFIPALMNIGDVHNGMRIYKFIVHNPSLFLQILFVFIEFDTH